MKPLYNDALRVICERIKNHCSNGLLQPCKFYSFPRLDVDGHDSLPNVSLLGLTSEEQLFEMVANTNRNLLSVEHEYLFKLAFNKDNGIYSQDGEKPYGLMDWVSRFLDSIETDEDGLLDLYLTGSVIEPLLSSVDGFETRELSCDITFRVKVIPRPLGRGSRHLQSDYIPEGEAFPSQFPVVLS